MEVTAYILIPWKQERGSQTGRKWKHVTDYAPRLFSNAFFLTGPLGGKGFGTILAALYKAHHPLRWNPVYEAVMWSTDPPSLPVRRITLINITTSDFWTSTQFPRPFFSCEAPAMDGIGNHLRSRAKSVAYAPIGRRSTCRAKAFYLRERRWALLILADCRSGIKDMQPG